MEQNMMWRAVPAILVSALVCGCASYESRVVDSGPEQITLEPGSYANPSFPANEHCEGRSTVAVLENVTYRNEQPRYFFHCKTDSRPVIGPWTVDS